MWIKHVVQSHCPILERDYRVQPGNTATFSLQLAGLCTGSVELNQMVNNSSGDVYVYTNMLLIAPYPISPTHFPSPLHSGTLIPH